MQCLGWTGLGWRCLARPLAGCFCFISNMMTLGWTDTEAEAETRGSHVTFACIALKQRLGRVCMLA